MWADLKLTFNNVGSVSWLVDAYMFMQGYPIYPTPPLRQDMTQGQLLKCRVISHSTAMKIVCELCLYQYKSICFRSRNTQNNLWRQNSAITCASLHNRKYIPTLRIYPKLNIVQVKFEGHFLCTCGDLGINNKTPNWMLTRQLPHTKCYKRVAMHKALRIHPVKNQKKKKNNKKVK